MLLSIIEIALRASPVLLEFSDVRDIAAGLVRIEYIKVLKIQQGGEPSKAAPPKQSVHLVQFIRRDGRGATIRYVAKAYNNEEHKQVKCC